MGLASKDEQRKKERDVEMTANGRDECHCDNAET